MAKVKAYYDHDLSGLVASATTSGYSVDNLLIFLESSLWKGVGTGTHTITFDAGVGNTVTADYVGVANHNLSGATFKLQYSTDNFAADINDAVSFSPADNFPFLKEFTSQDKRYWRIQLTGLTAVPFMGIAYWGDRVEWDYPALFDPDNESNKAKINLSPTGYLLGINNKYIERSISLKFRRADDGGTLWNALRAWWENHGLNLLFIAWDIDNHPNDIFFVYPDPKFRGRFTTANRREVNLTFKGRVAR
jgi:hypothetical protein